MPNPGGCYHAGVTDEKTQAQRGPRALLSSPWFWAALMGLIAIPAMRPFLRYEPAPPPVLYQLPAYRLVDSSGAPFGSAELAGQVYVADFIFTRCGSICPLLTRAMQSLDERYREAGVDGIRLVSISVDPQYDTPEILRQYEQAYGLDPGRFRLLTGPQSDIRSLITTGFRLDYDDGTDADMPAAESAESEDLIELAHTGKLFLVDQRGAVRGLYDIDEAGLDEVFHRSQHVLNERR